MFRLQETRLEEQEGNGGEHSTMKEEDAPIE
jgi:hypothetical protein